jgi:hypothetical protein
MGFSAATCSGASSLLAGVGAASIPVALPLPMSCATSVCAASLLGDAAAASTPAPISDATPIANVKLEGKLDSSTFASRLHQLMRRGDTPPASAPAAALAPEVGSKMLGVPSKGGSALMPASRGPQSRALGQGFAVVNVSPRQARKSR